MQISEQLSFRFPPEMLCCRMRKKLRNRQKFLLHKSLKSPLLQCGHVSEGCFDQGVTRASHVRLRPRVCGKAKV